MDADEVFNVPAEDTELFVPAEEPCAFFVPPDNEPFEVMRGDNAAQT